MHVLDKERLRECREKMGISKQEAAKRIKVSQPAYLRYEAGQRNPSIQIINEMSIVFNTSTDYLIGVSDDDIPNNIIISEVSDPELFKFVSVYQKLDSSRQKRLLAYAGKLLP